MLRHQAGGAIVPEPAQKAKDLTPTHVHQCRRGRNREPTIRKVDQYAKSGRLPRTYLKTYGRPVAFHPVTTALRA
jgi:hypothetical protein